MNTLQWVVVSVTVFCCICWIIAAILERKKVRIKYHHWIPRQLLVDGITLYPWILFGIKKKYVKKYAVKHEFIHVRQVIHKGLVLFYLTYILSWLGNSIKKIFGGLKGKTAYDAIGYEIEAYAKQDGDLTREEKRIFEAS